jgi:hypothetical protein
MNDSISLKKLVTKFSKLPGGGEQKLVNHQVLVIRLMEKFCVPSVPQETAYCCFIH